MNVNIYWLVVAAIILFGTSMPQHGQNRKYYIILMALLHTFVCGCRYMYITGDLIKYNVTYYDVQFFGYFSERVLHSGKNTGFYWFMKFFADISNADFQLLLIAIAIIIEVAVAILVYKYSTIPWLSYLVWDCMGFYMFGFAAIKQAMAMAILMFALIYIIEEELIKFLILTLIAGFIHAPSLAFLPAYWVAKTKIKSYTVIGYVIAAIIIFALRNQVVTFLTDLYYEEEEFSQATEIALGRRFYMMVLILICGIVLKGFADCEFEKIFNILIVAAIFQMFSGYDNIFTRFADYYFQFSILYFPLLFSNEETDERLISTNSGAIFPFNVRSLRVFAIVIAIVLIWYYQITTLGTGIDPSTQEVVNYHFMWEDVNYLQ